MRTAPLLFALLLLAPAAMAQTVLFDVPGPGGSTLFHLNADASLVARGVFGEGSIPVQGPGVRLMWYPAKGAFRAGGIDDRQWNDSNIGDYSVAMGFGTTASGEWSTAMGRFTTASGEWSIAMGRLTTASGISSIAIGSVTEANGTLATAMGNSTTAQAYASLVLGRYNIIAGNAIAWIPSDPILVVGNGTDTTPSNAFTLLKNGNLTIAGSLTENSDRRLKEDITSLNDVLDDLARLQPVRYRFREGTNRPEGRHIGLIAQEVASVFPELVSANSGGYLSVSYTHLTAVLVQALNEQQAEMKAQQSRLEAQHREIEALKTHLARLEAALLPRPTSASLNDR